MNSRNNKEDTKTLVFVIIFLSMFVILLFGLRSLM
jgi:hypothetical protein